VRRKCLGQFDLAGASRHCLSQSGVSFPSAVSGLTITEHVEHSWISVLTGPTNSRRY
jgi:hypothetical protein